MPPWRNSQVTKFIMIFDLFTIFKTILYILFSFWKVMTYAFLIESDTANKHSNATNVCFNLWTDYVNKMQAYYTYIHAYIHTHIHT